MQVFNKNKKQDDVKLLNDVPISITFVSNKPAILNYSNGVKCCSGCINCKNKKCKYFNNEEISVSNIKDLAFDTNENVCPVNALQIVNGKLCIDNKKCIKCGLCAKRCPLGAIYFDGQNFNVNYNADNILRNATSNSDIDLHFVQIEKLSKTIKNGPILIESDDLLRIIYESISKIDSKLHNLVVRNLLIGLGCHVSNRRIGDVYTRMDAVYSYNNCLGAIEIEFGKDTLDASRAILDDIATLNVRYNIDKSKNYPVVICLQLPNARQGYWQVIKDIKNVENIKIQTLSIGSLLLLLWNNQICKFDEKPFYLDYDNMSLRDQIEKILGRKINISNCFIGILEPMK